MITEREMLASEVPHAKTSRDPFQRVAAEAVENSGHMTYENGDNAQKVFAIKERDELELGVDGLVRLQSIVTARQLSEHVGAEY